MNHAECQKCENKELKKGLESAMDWIFPDYYQCKFGYEVFPSMAYCCPDYRVVEDRS